jgi:hypothetical protein
MANEKTKKLLSVDWTTTNGLTPYYVSSSEGIGPYYAVAVPAGSDYETTKDSAFQKSIKMEAVVKILESKNKNTIENVNSITSSALIPIGASGTYVPVREIETIKMLVKVPVSSIDSLSEVPYVRPAPYDIINLDTFNLTKRIETISSILDNFDTEVNNFDGKIYNINLANEATRIKQIPLILQKLVQDNDLVYDETRAQRITLGMSGSGLYSSEYKPIYAVLNSDNNTSDLTRGFNNFRDSEFVTSNTMYIYKNLDEIEANFAGFGQIQGKDGPIHTGNPSNLGWEYFVKKYIHFPSAIIKNTEGRARSPIRDAAVEKTRELMNKNPIKDSDALALEEFRSNQRKFKQKIDEEKKAAVDFVGDNVIANIDKSIGYINKAEDLYGEYLDKLGIRYVVDAAARCLQINLPIEEIKAFLRTVNGVFEDVIEILQIPTITLDDLIPTVDIMFDILEQVLITIAEAVFTALWDMIRQILIILLENCGDISKANFGGVPIGDAFQKGGLGGVFNATSGILGDTVTSQFSFDNITRGVLNTQGSGANTKRFISNLYTFVNNDKMQELIDSGFQAVNETVGLISISLTPGEMVKGLRGSPPDSVITITQNAARSLPNDTPGKQTVIELLDSKEKVRDFYFTLSKFLDDESGILEQIDQFDKFIPGFTNGLCDLDDSEVRCRLLEGRGLTAAECKDQIEASRQRATKMLNELDEVLTDPNFLQNSMPPMFSTNGQAGMFNMGHESLDFMLDRTLNTIFDGTENNFEKDISRVPELLKLQTFETSPVITRTIVSNDESSFSIDGANRKINPEFQLAVLQNNTPYPPFIQYGPLKDKDGAISDKSPPPAEDVERGIKKTISDSWDIDKAVADPTKDLDGFTKTISKNTFIPGISESYGNFRTYTRKGKDDLGNIEARNLLDVDKTVLQIRLENQVKGLIQQYGQNSQLYNLLNRQFANDPNLLSTIGVDQYTIVFQQFTKQEKDIEKFSVVVRADTKNLYKKIHTIKKDDKTMRIIDGRELDFRVSLDDVSDKEVYFDNFLGKILENGERILNSELQVLPKEEYMRLDVTKEGAPPNAVAYYLGINQDDSNNVRSLYEELWRDLVADFMNHISEDNNLLRFSYDLLNLNPIKTPVCPEPSLLGVKGIKDIIKKKYRQLKSVDIRKSLPNVSGLGDNRDNAIEQSILYGVIKAIIRVYSLETFLRTLVTFNKISFAYEPYDIAFVGYIEEKISDGMRKRGIFDDFKEQVIKSFETEPGNAIIPSTYENAIRFYVTRELKYSSKTLLKLAGAEGDKEKSNKVLLDLIEEYDAGEYIRATSASSTLTGIKDWRNGNFYFEKYVRAKLKPPGERPQLTNSPPTLPDGVFSVKEFQSRISSALENNPITTNAPPPTTVQNQSGQGKECEPFVAIPEPRVTIEEQSDSLSNFYEYIRYGYRLVCQIPEQSGRSPFFAGIGRDLISKSKNIINSNKNKTYIHPEVKFGGLSELKTFNFPIVCVEKEQGLEIPTETYLGKDYFVKQSGNHFPSLRSRILETDEWSFMFRYCFPTDRAVSVAGMYNLFYTQTFPGLDTVFDNTKEHLRLAFLSILRSGNYQFDDQFATNKNFAQNSIQGKIPGLDPGKMAYMFIMGLLKAAAEQFSPNIFIATKLKLVAEAAASIAAGIPGDPLKINEPPNPAVQEVCPEDANDFLDVLSKGIIPYSLGQLPVDLIPPPFGIGPPLTPLGYLYLANEGLFDDLFKSREIKDLERCAKPQFKNKPCPEDEEEE